MAEWCCNITVMMQLTTGWILAIAQILICIYAFISGDKDGRTDAKMKENRRAGWHRIGVAMYCIVCFPWVFFFFGWLFLVNCFLAWCAWHHLGYNAYTPGGWDYMGDLKEWSERVLKTLFQTGLTQMAICMGLLVIFNVYLAAKGYQWHPIFTIKQ